MLKKSMAVAVIFGILASAAPQISFAAASADLTLSPFRTVLITLLSPFATSAGSSVGSSQASAANRELVVAAAKDHAAAHMDGEEPTVLLQEVHKLMREELKKRGDTKDHTDLELSAMIIAD